MPTGFALAAPAIAVIRDQPRKGGKVLWLGSALLGVGAAALVCFLMVSNPLLAGLLLTGFVAVCLVFGAVFWALLKGLARLEAQHNTKRAGIAVFKSMHRRAGMLVVQGVSLSLGLAALLILAVVQGDLVDRWQEVLPADAPNRFVFNIQPDQVQPIGTLIAEHTQQKPRLYPMVRGRLVRMNDQELRADELSNPRARRLLERELNISFSDTLPVQNTVVQGQWFSPGQTEPTASIETSVAERLNVKLGDTLTFDVAGTPLQVSVASIRDVRWDSMQPNFSS
ncbi:MAG: hypothetical protein HC848_03190 [Limnobacter sp.]|nr:hypothetical protein [Limnobacter sp.]